MIAESAITTARDALLAIESLRVAGVFPEDVFDSILYGAAQMPTESEILTARDALKAMSTLQTAGNFPEIVELALLSLIAENSGGGGASAVQSVNGQTGVVALTAANVGAEPSFATLSDAKVGDRTAVDTAAPTNLGPGSLTAWLGWIANRIKAITGATNWSDAPGTTLATTATHIGRTDNPHATTLAQVANTSQTANNFFGAPNGSNGVPAFRTLASADIPLATSTLKGAVSKEAAGTLNPLPTIEGSTTAGTQTYTSRSGSYYLVGNVCVATISIVLSAKDAAMAGNVVIGGLPFTGAATPQAITVAYYSQATLTANYTQLGGRVDASTNKITLYQSGSGQAVVAMPVASIAANFSIVLTAVYLIA